MKNSLVGKDTFIRTLPPYDNISNRTLYTVVSVEMITKLISDGNDVLTDVYEKVGLTASDMNTDVINKVPIVTLSGGGTRVISIPLNRLEFKNYGGQEYVRLGIGIDLGPLPIDTDFTDLQEEILVLIRARLGINGVSNIVQISKIDKVSIDDHELHVELREATRETTVSSFIQLEQTERELDSMTQLNEQLKDCIIQLKQP